MYVLGRHTNIIQTKTFFLILIISIYLFSYQQYYREKKSIMDHNTETLDPRFKKILVSQFHNRNNSIFLWFQLICIQLSIFEREYLITIHMIDIYIQGYQIFRGLSLFTKKKSFNKDYPFKTIMTWVKGPLDIKFHNKLKEVCDVN